MTNANIDFTLPLTLEDELDTTAIERLAAAIGATEATIRRWLYEEGELMALSPEAEARRPSLNPHYDLFQ